jgi:regulatory protein YycI of two-component signal transduction system YycFG
MKAGKIFILVVILIAITWLFYFFLTPKGKTKIIHLPKMEKVEEEFGVKNIDKYYIVENPPEDQHIFKRLMDSVAKKESTKDFTSLTIHFAYENEMSYRESTSAGDFYLSDLLGFCIIKKENNLLDVGTPVVYVGFDRFYKPKSK